ncbi:MAG: hypothetical protein Greene101449_951 [Candidatus Peregrinibacteria bacterium Greene1014_49]|nr:MAG: hypothetical protein Greene101449_951 [Candidatus Peregrinibacteria bacterium Greene1014_49]
MADELEQQKTKPTEQTSEIGRQSLVDGIAGGAMISLEQFSQNIVNFKLDDLDAFWKTISSRADALKKSGDKLAVAAKETKEETMANLVAALDVLEKEYKRRKDAIVEQPVVGTSNLLGDTVQKTSEVIGAGVTKTGEIAGGTVRYSGEQVGKALETGKQIFGNEADAWSKKSGWERATQVGGLAVLTGVPLYLIYKLAKRVSNAGLKDGEKPGFLRKILKFTGMVALSTAAVNFLGPRVLKAQEKKSEAGKPEKALYEESKAKDAVSEKILFGQTFLHTEVKIVEKDGVKLMKIGGKSLRLVKVGGQGNLVEKFVNMGAQPTPPQLIFNNGDICRFECAY